MTKPKTALEILSLREKNLIKKSLGITKFEEIDTAILKNLKEKLKALKDLRIKKKCIYKLWDIIMCVIVASFANNNEWDEIEQFVSDNYHFFKSFLQMTGGIPNAQTYERVMSLVDSNELNSILHDFYDSITNTTKINEVDFYRLDGRQNNGSRRSKTLSNEEVEPLNCLNVYSDNEEYCIDTIQISEKSNEIPSVENYIKGLDLTNVIITTDALNTQRDNVRAIVNANGDYCLPIKGNQGNLYEDLKLYFDKKTCETIIAGRTNSEYNCQFEKNHSSITKYEYFQTEDIKWIENKEDWLKIKSIGMVRKTITKVNTVSEEINGKVKRNKKEETSIEERYYITSLLSDIELFKKAVRGHWNIENKVHWHLDFTFKQDKNTTINKKALLNLEIVHKFNLAILNKVKPYYKLSLKAIRKHLSNNINKFFTEFIAFLILQKNAFSK